MHNKHYPNIYIGGVIAASFAIAIVGGIVSKGNYWWALTAAYCALLALLIAMRHINRRIWAQMSMQSTLLEKTQNLIQHIDSAKTGTVALNAVELHAMKILHRRFPQCDVPTTPWSMRFSNLHHLIELLDRVQPKFVVEFGSGISTLYIANWLKMCGSGRIVSFEHDPRWAQISRDQLQRHSLEDLAEVRIAPLREQTCLNRTVRWYDVDESINRLSDIDLLIVDGPPADRSENATFRFPAAILLKDCFSDCATIVLDDASRPGEKEVADLWNDSLRDFEMTFIPTMSGMAIFERSASIDSHA